MRYQRRGARLPWPRCRQSGEDPSPGRSAGGMTVLFWDIDGTLLTTARAGVFAWEDAVREFTGRDDFELARFRIAGMTDYQIAVKTFEELGVQADEAYVRRFVDRYGELLPSSL